jgi:PilZ domain
MQRRSKIRIQEPFPVTVRGVDRNGQEFLTETILDDVSAGGFYLRIPQHVEQGGKLFVVIQLSSENACKGITPRVAARGHVLRSEPKPDGRFGLAVEIRHHRFL